MTHGNFFKVITQAINILIISEGYDKENVKELLSSDSYNPVFQILNDVEIIDDLIDTKREVKEEK